jgi:hypothetical protein
MRLGWMPIALAAALTGASPVSAEDALALVGQAGILGEWELTANLSSAGRNAFAGPIVLKHTGICTVDGPETRNGDMRLQIANGSRLKATLTIDGVPCSYAATKSDGYSGTMSCRDRRDVPLRLWLK